MDRIEDRIISHLHGNETAEEARQLSEWIRERPEHAKQFAELALMHGQLRGLFSGEANVRDRNAIPESDAAVPAAACNSNAHEGNFRKVLSVIAAIAACVLVAVGIAVFLDGDGEQIADLTTNKKAVATLVQASDAVWEGVGIDEGSPIHPQTLALKSGMVRLEFVDGVEVTLKGPAKYDVIGVGRTRLRSGLLAAIVPPGAEGFQVDTPTAEVIDLGTAFGIVLGADGVAKVSVFDGEVEVRPTSSRAKRLVKGGESIRVISADEMEPSDFDAVAFEKVWPVSSGIVGSTGAFRFAPQWPDRLRFVQSDTEIFVLPEGYARSLDDPINVNITASGDYNAEANLTAGVIPIRSRVKCFLLQFNPVEHGSGDRRPPTERLNPEDLKRIVGEITFERPVLGLIVRGDELRATDGVFSQRGGRVPQKGRALELFGTPRDDVVTLSEDRHTVKLDLAAFGLFRDQVRVIVDQSLVEYENQGK